MATKNQPKKFNIDDIKDLEKAKDYIQILQSKIRRIEDKHKLEIEALKKQIELDEIDTQEVNFFENLSESATKTEPVKPTSTSAAAPASADTKFKTPEEVYRESKAQEKAMAEEDMLGF